MKYCTSKPIYKRTKLSTLTNSLLQVKGKEQNTILNNKYCQSLSFLR